MEDETKENAFYVYELFFGAYRISLAGARNPFLDLLDTLRDYEERAATLIEKQRDHFVHSLNVFILGLAIYAGNRNYRAAFEKAIMTPGKFPENLPTHRRSSSFAGGLPRCFTTWVIPSRSSATR